jgi:hypothetical protein
VVSTRLTSSDRRVRTRRVDDLVVSLLAALLPAGFRERQRGEWASDLLTLAGSAPGARLRYLWGAARTLPTLRRLARCGRSAGAVQLDAPIGAWQALARIVLLGMVWPMVSFAVWLPPRYYGADVPGVLKRSDYTALVDAHAVWPLGHTPDWLTFVWWIPQYGTLAVATGPILFTVVGLIGGLVAWLRRRRRPVKGRAVALVVAASLVLGVGLSALMQGGDDHVVLPLPAAVLGVTAVLLGVTTAGLTRRERIGLVLLGLTSVAAFASFFTSPSMFGWLID